MYQIFLGVISLLAAGYCFFTKQAKMGLGFIIYAVAFVLLNPDLAEGVKSDFYGALALVLFVFGSLVICYKKKVTEVSKTSEDPKDN